MFEQPSQHLKSKFQNLQAELSKEQEQTACIFKWSSDELILTDLKFNIISRNNRLLSKSLSNIHNFLEILTIYSQDEALEIIKNFTLSTEKETAFRLILPEDNAVDVQRNEKYTKATITKIRRNDIHCGYLIVLNDYTEEIERIKQRDCFVEMLTHDLRTPALAEARALELLYEGSLGDMNDDQKDMIREILNSSRYMIRMTDNVLTNLRFETEGIKLNKKLHSIKHTIERCISEIKYMLEDSKQTIKISSENSYDKFLYDEETIKLVITNILTNASEHSPKNATIYITIKKQKNYITVSIRDEGQGIAPDRIEDIFKEHTSLTQRFKKVGSGLGLFISKKIMECHNGSIILNEKLSKGTEFILSLPYNTKMITSTCDII